jgi:hypothetical protein
MQVEFPIAFCKLTEKYSQIKKGHKEDRQNPDLRILLKRRD